MCAYVWAGSSAANLGPCAGGNALSSQRVCAYNVNMCKAECIIFASVGRGAGGKMHCLSNESVHPHEHVVRLKLQYSYVRMCGLVPVPPVYDPVLWKCIVLPAGMCIPQTCVRLNV